MQSEEAISLVDSAQSAIEPILKTRPWPVQRFFVQTVWICKTLTTRLSIHFKQKDILITYLHVIIFVRHHISFSNFRFTFREGMPAWKVYDYMSVLVLICDNEKVWKPNISLASSSSSDLCRRLQHWRWHCFEDTFRDLCCPTFLFICVICRTQT